MAEEENSDGCFTRAYIRAAFSERAAERKIWGALLSLMASKDQVGWVWDNWLSERLKRHSKTDSRIELRVVRLAADGVWLERIVNAKSKNLKGVEEYLIEMTRIPLRAPRILRWKPVLVGANWFSTSIPEKSN